MQETLNKLGIIPNGLNIPLDLKIVEARATNYEYTGNKYAESNEYFENTAISLKIEHSQISNPFWITIFEGATYREESTRCIIATEEPTIDENFNINMANGTIYEADCMTNDNSIEGLYIIQEVIFAFKCKIYDGDITGLYTDFAASEYNPSIIYDCAIELIDANFVLINETISKSKPKAAVLSDLHNTFGEVAKNKLYLVSVVCDSEIKHYTPYLNKEDAEKIFLEYCNTYYCQQGLEQYALLKNNMQVEDMCIKDWNSYYHSGSWYDVNDVAHVEMKLM